MNKKIGVIAGSPVDTQMGADFLIAKGLEAFPYPAAEAAREQTEFQMAPEEVRTQKIRDILKTAIADGMDAIMIYCNSLSSTVDMNKLSKELNVKIVTPLNAYEKFAAKYNNIGVIAGNNQGLAGIERTILNKNAACNVIGLSLLPMVVKIEEKPAPAEIVDFFGLEIILKFYEHLGVDALILGCTHFPYIYDELIKHTKIDILDPAETMYELLCK